MLRRRTRGRHAGCLGIVAAGAAGPQRLGTIVKVIRGRGSLHHEIEDRRAAHHFDRSFKRKISEPLSVAPDYHVAGLQTRRSRGTALPRALKDSLFINKIHHPVRSFRAGREIFETSNPKRKNSE